MCLMKAITACQLQVQTILYITLGELYPVFHIEAISINKSKWSYKGATTLRALSIRRQIACVGDTTSVIRQSKHIRRICVLNLKCVFSGS